MLSLLAISLFERFSSSESRTSCSRRLRLVTESVFRRRPWPVRMESTNPERSWRGTQNPPLATRDRKSTRLNSSHVSISYAVFCLKKKKYYIKCILLYDHIILDL